MKKLLRTQYLTLLYLVSLMSLLTSCTPLTPEKQARFRQHILNQAQEQGFIQYGIQTDFFTLSTFSHITELFSKRLIIYLEGDGNSYQSKYQASYDPTPYRPLGLQLALKDPRLPIVYIARPGQYSLLCKSCPGKYWSSHRFSPEVIKATNQAIDFFKYQTGAHTIQLIGFSGGGGLAVLVAADRLDVDSLITIAGDLDTQKMSLYHKTPFKKHSLNPVDKAKALREIPQWHWVGKYDRVVPLKIAQSYLKASDHNLTDKKINLHVNVVKAGHQMGWVEKWPDLILYFE